MIIDNLTTEKDNAFNGRGYIDSDRLMHVAKSQGVEDDPKFLKVYRSIRTNELEIATQRQYNECDSCSKEGPCCQLSCELYDKLQDRFEQKWEEDVIRGGIDPCRNCPSEAQCTKFEQEVKVSKLKIDLTKKQWSKVFELDMKDRTTFLNEVSEPNKTKTMKKEVTAKDIKISIDDLDLETKSRLKVAGIIDEISIDTDLSSVNDKVVYTLVDMVKDKLDKLYAPYKKQKKIDSKEDEKLEDIKERIKDEVAGYRSSKHIHTTNKKVTQCSERVILNLVDVAGKVKDGATGAVLKKYGIYGEYMKQCASVGKYHRKNLVGHVDVFNKRGKVIILLYINKGKPDLNRLRLALKDIDKTLGGAEVAMPYYSNISENNRFKAVLKILDSEITLYDPWRDNR